MTTKDEDARGHKRSLSIAGHRTSVSLEEPFWRGLHAIAAAERCSLADLVARIDAARGLNNLSSALRLRVLAYYQALAEQAEGELGSGHWPAAKNGNGFP